jgi:hypothetical protein
MYDKVAKYKLMSICWALGIAPSSAKSTGLYLGTPFTRTEYKAHCAMLTHNEYERTEAYGLIA